MPGRGRPERPISTVGGPLSQLAGELRRLRGDRTYRDLAAEADLSVTTLRTAAAGEHLPTWRVTRAFVLACDGESTMGAIRELWEKACIAAGRPVPDDNPPAEEPPMPDPEIILNGAQFIEEMKRLRAWAGNPSLAELNRRSGGFLLPPSTVSGVLRKDKLPRLGLVQAYVRACGLNDGETAAWEQTWAIVTAREMQKQISRTENPGRIPNTSPEGHGSESRATVFRGALRWLSGVPAVSLHVPASSADYAGLGSIILLASTILTLAAAWAAHVVLTPKWPAAILTGVVVGAVIMGMNRLAVASMHHGHGLKNLLAAVPHLILSLLLALLIATPIALRIFAPEINAHIVTAQYEAQTTTWNNINVKYNPQIQELLDSLSKEQGQLTATQVPAECELIGGSNCRPGQSAAYAKALKNYEATLQKISRIQGRINNLRAQQTTAQKDVVATASQNEQGLLSNLAALNQVTDDNVTIAVVRWLLFGLFILLGCAPVIAKALKIMGTPKAGEYTEGSAGAFYNQGAGKMRAPARLAE